jgi:hypothetical protein
MYFYYPKDNVVTLVVITNDDELVSVGTNDNLVVRCFSVY